MPIANDFLSTFDRLWISEHPWVLIGKVLNFARDHKGIPCERFFTSGLDIEEFHSEIEEHLIDSLRNSRRKDKEWLNVILDHGVFVELVFVFAATINAIQNGPASLAHLSLAKMLSVEDVAITFNWDTLMDRALAQQTSWDTGSGYGFRPRKIFRNGWEMPETDVTAPSPTLLKLHGSTNWLTSYPIIDDKNRKVGLTQTAPVETVYVYESTLDSYDTFAGRYMEGFERFSYGYYPPNLPDDPGKSAEEGHMLFQVRPKFPWMPEGKGGDAGLVSSPLIIPPVRKKSYSMFGNLFTDLWEKAGVALRDAEHVIVIGYSFPRTDVQSVELFKRAFSSRKGHPRITIVDPAPERPNDIFVREFGVPPANVKVFKEYFTDTFDLSRVFD